VIIQLKVVRKSTSKQQKVVGKMTVIPQKAVEKSAKVARE